MFRPNEMVSVLDSDKVTICKVQFVGLNHVAQQFVTRNEHHGNLEISFVNATKRPEKVQ